MIIIPHNTSMFTCLSTDIDWDGSGSSVSGLETIGAILYVSDTQTNYIVLDTLYLSPLVYNIA